MLLAGFQFAIGFWLGTMGFVAVLMSLIGLTSYIGGSCEREKKKPPEPSQMKVRDMLWMRAPESVSHEHGSVQTFSVRTLVRWGERKSSDDRRKEPHYRYRIP